jgi:hypothetical protein
LRERAGVALRELTGRLSDRLPLVLFIDDIQWDDEDSAWLLSKLFQEPDPPAVMLICTCRTEVRAESHLLRSLETEPTTARLLREIPLPALSVDETIALTGHASAAVLQQPELADRIAAESGGHPMFALELARFAHGSPHRGREALRTCAPAARDGLRRRATAHVQRGASGRRLRGRRAARGRQQQVGDDLGHGQSRYAQRLSRSDSRK